MKRIVKLQLALATTLVVTAVAVHANNAIRAMDEHQREIAQMPVVHLAPIVIEGHAPGHAAPQAASNR